MKSPDENSSNCLALRFFVHFRLLGGLKSPELSDDGMKVVNYLGAIINNKCTCVPDKLRAWQNASQIERPAQREKETAPATPAKP